MKTRILALFVIFSVHTYGQSWQWATRGGGSSDDLGNDIIVDANKNAYITGNFKNTCNFGTITKTSYGNSDIFVAKLDLNGNYEWVTQMGSNSSSGDIGEGITQDASGNIYSTGYFYGTATFGDTSFTATGCDFYVARINPSTGNVLWALHSTGAGNDMGYAIAANDSDHIYVSGLFKDSIYIGTYKIVSEPSEFNIFIACLNSKGEVNWAKKAGGSGADKVNAIHADSRNNFYIAGKVTGTAYFDNFSVSTGYDGSDAFFLKGDMSGVFIWVVNPGSVGSSISSGASITSDAEENVIIHGSFDNLIDFWGDTISTANVKDQIFTGKLDSLGALLWLVTAGGDEDDVATDVCTDKFNNIYITGSYGGVYGGDAVFGNDTLFNCSSSYSDIYVAKLNPFGNFQWALSAGGANNNAATGIALDDDNDTYVVAYSSSGSINYDTISLSSYGSADFSIARIEHCTDTIVLSVIGNVHFCEGDSAVLFTADNFTNYTWSNGEAGNAIIVSTSGGYYLDATDFSGCYFTSNKIDVSVETFPQVSLSLAFDSLCDYSAPVLLSGGLPLGGIYYGTGVTSGYFDPSATGTGLFQLIYTYSTQAGCASSDTDYVYVDICTDIKEISRGVISVFPNPFKDALTIGGLPENNEITVILNDMTGREIIRKTSSAGRMIIDTSEMEQGIYFCAIYINSILLKSNLINHISY